MLKNSPIMLALCFMLSSPYYAENYAGIIDTSLGRIPISGLVVAYLIMFSFPCMILLYLAAPFFTLKVFLDEIIHTQKPLLEYVTQSSRQNHQKKGLDE